MGFFIFIRCRGLFCLQPRTEAESQKTRRSCSKKKPIPLFSSPSPPPDTHSHHQPPAPSPSRWRSAQEPREAPVISVTSPGTAHAQVFLKAFASNCVAFCRNRSESPFDPVTVAMVPYRAPAWARAVSVAALIARLSSAVARGQHQRSATDAMRDSTVARLASLRSG